MNKNTVQRVFQIMGWQVRKRPVGFRPRIQALPSVASAPEERWAKDVCRIWCGRDRIGLLVDRLEPHLFHQRGDVTPSDTRIARAAQDVTQGPGSNKGVVQMQTVHGRHVLPQ